MGGGRIYTAKDISTVAQSMTSVSSTLQSMQRERRERVASYLDEIGLTLAEISVALREGQHPSELYGAMQMHTLMFAETVSGVIDQNLIDRFQVLLGSWTDRDFKSDLTHPVPMGSEESDFPEHDGLTPITEQLIDYRLRKFNGASGMFRALASSIRAQA